MIRGDYEAARPLLEEALAMARSVGEPGRIAEIAGSLGYLLLLKRDLDPAASLLKEEVEIARGTGNRFQWRTGRPPWWRST
jgi:hypothetical protein